MLLIPLLLLVIEISKKLVIEELGFIDPGHDENTNFAIVSGVVFLAACHFSIDGGLSISKGSIIDIDSTGRSIVQMILNQLRFHLESWPCHGKLVPATIAIAPSLRQIL